MTELKQRILPTVQKPARYTGGEWGEIKRIYRMSGSVWRSVSLIHTKLACPMWECGFCMA